MTGRHREHPPPFWEDFYHAAVRGSVDFLLGFVLIVMGAFAPVRPVRDEEEEGRRAS